MNTNEYVRYLYGIGYGLIPNAKFCKQVLYYIAKVYIEIRNESLVWHSVQIHM